MVPAKLRDIFQGTCPAKFSPLLNCSMRCSILITHKVILRAISPIYKSELDLGCAWSYDHMMYHGNKTVTKVLSQKSWGGGGGAPLQADTSKSIGSLRKTEISRIPKRHFADEVTLCLHYHGQRSVWTEEKERGAGLSGCKNGLAYHHYRCYVHSSFLGCKVQ